ncbi:Meiosis-specific nuclear structural protein [Heracleum sosnowskyi]|uniref:Meiosis-specific nuclear structural protein n=1 Tax=Heracleum sosnowskyi TaxID=360622 RepID=A0AAD8IXA2_9APIA|nr:Meiosis-specific nuclear structural protein [Heracleum sosnowskyi]
MSVNLHYPQAMNSLTDLQIYNNAVFDNVENQITPSCSPVKSVSFSDISKENQSPVSPLNPNPKGTSRVKLMKEVRDEKKIDIEIEEIEKEICRLSERLKVLKLEKEQKNGKLVEKRVRIVPAKFMEQKQNLRSDCNLGDVKKSDENLLVSAKSKGFRRGVSMCPGEILAGASRRGLSLGPSEIGAGSKFRPMYKPEVTPVESMKSRRKSCFLKLGDVDEMRVIKERGKSCSLSPKSRKAMNKTQGARQVVTTVGTKKGVKKDDGVLAAIQPKNLFKDGEKSVAAKKPVKSGRVIASRYNQSTMLSAMRKRSLPENDKDEGMKCDRKRSLSVGKSRESMPEISGIQGTKSCMKKRWEVPSETVVCGKIMVPDVLPKIRTARYTIDTPRDSGAAKRVAELIGKKSFFSNGGDVDSSVCQELSFAEEA